MTKKEEGDEEDKKKWIKETNEWWNEGWKC